MSSSCFRPLAQLSRRSLLTKFGPVEVEPKSPARKLSLDEFQRLDSDVRFVVAVCGVEVRRLVVAIVHADDDSEEDAECWHVKALVLLRESTQGALHLRTVARLIAVGDLQVAADARQEFGGRYEAPGQTDQFERRDNGPMPIFSSGLVHQGQLDAEIESAVHKLGPEAVHVTHNVGTNSNGEPSIFFRIVLADSASREDTLTETTGRIATILFDELRPIENWGLHPYFNFRSQSEQQKRKDSK